MIKSLIPNTTIISCSKQEIDAINNDEIYRFLNLYCDGLTAKDAVFHFDIINTISIVANIIFTAAHIM